MGAPPADQPTVQQASAASAHPRKSRRFLFGLALGWLVVAFYIVWLAHNALPWLTAGAPLPPDALARLIALPPLPAVFAPFIAASGLSATLISALAAALVAALALVLLALTFAPLPALTDAIATRATSASSPLNAIVKAPVAPPHVEPAITPAAAEPAAALSPAPMPTPTLRGAETPAPPPAPSPAATTRRRIFISHASADNPFGEALAARLRADLGGVDAVFYDALGEADTPTDGMEPIGWRGGIHPASYWELDIFRQLRERPVFVVLLSPAALDSPWVQDEILLAWKQKNERGRAQPKVIVPVLLPDASDLAIPEPLDIIQAISFAPRPDATNEAIDPYEALLVAIRADRTSLRPGEPEPPFDLTTLEVPNPFVGREEDLRWLLERLTPGATSAITALRGLGGIGKSGLAAMAIQRVFEDGRFPSGIVVQECAQLSDPVAVLRGVLASFDPDHNPPKASDLKALGEQADKLLRGRKMLIVLDNIEPELDTNAVLQRLRPAGPALLLTARETLPLPPGATLELALLSPATALDLFAEWYLPGDVVGAAALSPNDRPLAERIVAALGQHTLAVKLAGAEARDLDRPLSKFTTEVEAHPLRIQGQDANATLVVKETLMRSITKLPTSGELGDVRRLFAALAVFQGPVFEQTSASTSAVRLVPSLAFGRRAAIAIAAGLGLPDPGRAIDLLTRRALLDKSTDPGMPPDSDRERLRLHPLLRELASELLDEPTREIAALALARFYADYVFTVPDFALSADAGSIAGALEWVHVAPTTTLAEDERTTLTANICSGTRQLWSGRVRERQRYLPWAVAAYTAALTVYTREAAPSDWAMTQNNLGTALRDQAGLAEGEARAGLLARAVAAYTAALTVRTREAAPSDWAGTQFNLALLYITMTEEATASAERLRLLRDALACAQGARDVFVGTTYSRQANELCAMIEEAIREEPGE